MRQIKHKTSATEPLIRWNMTIKFMVLFAFGIVLAWGFAVLVSLTELPEDLSQVKSSVLLEEGWQKVLFPIDKSTFQTYLNLTLAGTFGGLLCSILVGEGKMLEFPSWAKNGKGLKPGFLGNIFVGIAGAFIAYIALAKFLKGEAGITIFVVGLVGGYGGEYVMDAALKRLIEQTKDADLIEEELEEINQVEDLQNLANRQIYQGLAPDELWELQTQLRTFSLDPEVKEGIFNVARDARRLGSRVKAYEGRIKRAIPILEALVQSDDNNHRYHAQLACAYRDSVPARLDEAISEFNQAIARRDPTTGDHWRHELDRVVALIYKALQEGEPNAENSPSSGKIWADLLTIDRNQGLTRVFEEFDRARTSPIKDWLEKNQDWLQQHPEGKTLLAQVARAPSAVSTEPVSPRQPSPISTNGLTAKPVMVKTPGRIHPGGLFTKVPITKPAVVRTAIKPDRWDRALKKAFTISTGASRATAKQDGLRTGGASASRKMAQTDWPKIEKYAGRFYQAALKYDVPPAIIAAICSRESRGGSALAADGTGDKGRAFGLMQVDRRYWSQAGSGGDPGSQTHINQGTEIYANYRNQVSNIHANWTDEYLLKGAAVAYNSGIENVQTKSGMDRGTTGNDYGSDVIARAKFYAQKLNSLAECKAEQTQAIGVNEDRPTAPQVLPVQVEIQKITALIDTFLKKQPVQSTQLPEEQKLAVAAGQSYDVEAYQDVGGGHYWVKLADNGGEWYIYDSETYAHWDTTWEGDETDTDTSLRPDRAVGKIHDTPGSIDWDNSSLRISKYFTVGEVTKNDRRRRPLPNSAEEKHILALAKELDQIREDWGSSVIVNSWFRPSKRLGYPYEINGIYSKVSNSQHIYGRAADIRPARGNIYDFQKWLERNWYGHLGRGANKGFVHLDTRNGKGWKTGGKKGGRFSY